MHAVGGRVRGGRIETDAALPEGPEVVVLTRGDAEPFELENVQFDELERRIADADRGELEPGEDVLRRLRRSR